MVGDKKFDYSSAGFKQAKAYAKKSGKPMRMDKKKKMGAGGKGKASMMGKYS
jgi:hypothetical protein